MRYCTTNWFRHIVFKYWSEFDPSLRVILLREAITRSSEYGSRPMIFLVHTQLDNFTMLISSKCMRYYRRLHWSMLDSSIGLKRKKKQATVTQATISFKCRKSPFFLLFPNSRFIAYFYRGATVQCICLTTTCHICQVHDPNFYWNLGKEKNINYVVDNSL